jgi:hypothetical protein
MRKGRKCVVFSVALRKKLKLSFPKQGWSGWNTTARDCVSAQLRFMARWSSVSFNFLWLLSLKHSDFDSSEDSVHAAYGPFDGKMSLNSLQSTQVDDN